MALYPFNTVGLTALTAAGTTAATEVKASEVTFQVTVTNINTNAVVRFEGSLDNTNFSILTSQAQTQQSQQTAPMDLR